MMHVRFLTGVASFNGAAALRFSIFACLPALWSGIGFAQYHPDHPEVIAMVDKATAALEANADAKTHYSLNQISSGGHGELALSGYAHMKVFHNPDNRVVQKGVAASKEFVQRLGGEDLGKGGVVKIVYTAATVGLLLAEVDKKLYEPELRRLAQFLNSMRFSVGAYGYPDTPAGDVSQTQYAMLLFWTLDRHSIPIDYPGIGKSGAWLLQVQDRNGGWPYHAPLPGGPPVSNRHGVTPSMAVAGGSALLIAADIQRAFGDVFGSPDDPNIPGLPEAVKLYVDGDYAAKNRRTTISADKVADRISRCQGYLATNSANVADLESEWPYYQLYTQERYESFREALLDLPKNKSPDWYNSGVNYLKGKQQASGMWAANSGHTTDNTSTAFAVLFLIRGTQRAIQESAAGSLAGGYGLPSDTTKIRVDGTQIKGKAVATAVTDLLSILEDDGGDAMEGKSIPENLELATDPKERASQIDRMQRLVQGSQSWQARRVASRLLGQSDDLKVVPTLIFALTDPDPMVKRYARDGLRFISRKFEGFGMPDKPNPVELRAAQRDWKKWYLSMHPGHVFLDDI
ncbi:MAG: hypothetical protein AAGD07_06130 [Planctomycetota bacterium]